MLAYSTKLKFVILGLGIFLAQGSAVPSVHGQTQHTVADSSLVSSVQAGFFSSDKILPLKLFSDLNVLLKDRGEDPSEHPARIVYVDEAGDSVIQDLQVRVRGNFRRQQAHCSFPPLRLNFKKKEVQGTLFSALDKVKLVTHCKDHQKKYEQQVLLEYLVYRMYNQIAEPGFGVRLVRMTYHDLSGKREPFSRYGFLIEDEDEMAGRNDALLVNLKGMHQDSTHFDHITRLSIFQYLIGNTDWSVPALHNIRLVKKEDVDKLIPVPYDFDWSGLVNAPYATPAKNLPIQEVRERVFRGYCRSAEELQPHFDLFNEQQEPLMALINDLEPLDRKFKDSARRYINQFYKTINSSKRIRRQFIKVCRRD